MTALFEAAAREGKAASPQVSVAVGIVTNNIDLVMEGKVLVRVSSIDQEVWARLCAPGAGSGAGLYYVPRIDDEVLVAFAQDEPREAFVLGGLWSIRDRVPATDPMTAVAKRVLRTGMTAAGGHEIELDDLQQSVTITTSTQQKITMDMTKIELSDTAGLVKVTLDTVAQSVTISAPAIIRLKAPNIDLDAQMVQISGTAAAIVKSDGVCSITGKLVKIN